MLKKIAINNFVKRQTCDSQYTHYDGKDEDMINHITKQFEKGCFSQGYRDGVILVHVNEKEAKKFYTYQDYPMFKDMDIETVFEKVPGREHEPARLQIKIKEPKMKCNYVDVVLYRHDILEEDGDNTTDSEWEIVSINGRLDKDPPPMKPFTIVRNWKHLEGGTKMKGKTAEEVLEILCESIMYENGIRNDN